MTRKEQIKEVARQEMQYLNEIITNLAFRMGADWADETMIEKACEWLEENMPNKFEDVQNYVDNFRKAMEKGDEQ